MSGISETVSKKRGRPPKFSDREIALAKWISPEATTARALHNIAYQQRALHVLCNDDDGEPYRHFLLSWDDLKAKGSKLPQTLLAMLGRLPEPELRQCAAEICQRKLLGREAVAFAKRWRLGSERPPFSQLDLVGVLAKAIDDYSASHDWTTSQIRMAVKSLELIVEERLSEIDSENQEGGE